MKNRGRAAVLALSLIVYGCGGGGGSGSGGGGAIVAPSPPPAPPPPPPPPVLTAVGAFGMLAEFRFYPTGIKPGATDVSSASGDRQGKYPIQSGQALFRVTFGSVPSNYASVAKTAFGIDASAGMLLSNAAPADATVISPLTTLLVGSNNEAKLETQLGINGSVFGLAVDRPIKSFVPTDALASTDPTVLADGERLLAHHIRVLAVAAAFEHMTSAASDPSGTKSYNIGGVRSYLDTAPSQFLYTNANMAALLSTVNFGGISPQPVYRSDVLSAAAHLVNAYASAIGVRIANRQQATRFTLGIWGYLVPELTRLLKANDAATASEILALTSQQVLDATVRFNEQLPFDPNDNFFPAPDFYPIPRGGAYIVPAVDVGSNGDGPLNSNDIHIEPNISDGNHFFPGTSQVTAVTIPTNNFTEISAVLNADGTVTIRPSASFTGVTYFDYTVRHSRGDVEQGRVYVLVR